MMDDEPQQIADASPAASVAVSEIAVDVALLEKHIVAVCVTLLEASPENIASALAANAELTRQFAGDGQVSVLVVRKHAEAGTEPGRENFTVGLEVAFDGQNTSSSVVFIKKFALVQSQRSVASQLQAIHLDEGAPFEVLHSYVHHTFKPFLQSYLSKVRLTKEEKDGKRGVSAIAKKISELEVALLHCKQEKEVPDVNLQNFACEEVRLAVAKIEGKKGIEDFVESFSVKVVASKELQNFLAASISSWSKEIQTLINLDRDPSTGSAAQEVNFWLSMERVLDDVVKQTATPEVDVTIASFQKLKIMRDIPHQFDIDVKELAKRLDVVKKYLSLMRDFPVNDILSSTDIAGLVSGLLNMFKHVKQNISRSLYPLDRCLNLLEAVSRDFTVHLVEILRKKRLMDAPPADFFALTGFSDRKADSASAYSGSATDALLTNPTCESIFTIWTAEEKEFITLAKTLEKKRGGKKFSSKSNMEHVSLQERIVQIVELRREHENLRGVIKKVMRSTSGGGGGSDMESSSLNIMKAAYAGVKSVDVLDVSKEGKDAFDAAIAQYHSMVERVENQMTVRLRDRLGAAQNANEMFRVFAIFNPLLIRPKIRGAIQEYQNTLIQRVKEDVKTLQEKFRSKYSKSEASIMSELRDVPPCSGAIIWAKQVERQLDTYMKRIEDVLGDGWQQHVEGQKLKKDGDSFREKLKPTQLFSQWCEDTLQFCIELESHVISSQIFLVTSRGGKLQLTVNFDSRIVDLLKEVRTLEHLSFSIPSKIKFATSESKVVYPCAMSISESVRTYSQALQVTSPAIVLLLASAHADVQKAVSLGIRLKWEPEKKYLTDNLEPYARNLSEQVLKFQDRVDEATTKHKEIDSQLEQLLACSLDPAHLTPILLTIQKLVGELELGSYSNLSHWVTGLDTKIEDILLRRLGELMDQVLLVYDAKGKDLDVNDEDEDDGSRARRKVATAILTRLRGAKSVHEIKIKNQVLYVEPPIELAKVKWMEHLASCLSIICDLPRVKGSSFGELADARRSKAASTPDTYSDLLSKVPAAVARLYSQVQETLDRAQKYVATWLNYQALWDIDSETITAKLGTDIETWQQVLVDVKKSRSVFDTSETVRLFGPVEINFQKVQGGVTSKYDIWHRELLHAFADRLGTSMVGFHRAISSTRETLETFALDRSTADALIFLTKMQELKRQRSEWAAQLDRFGNGQRTLEKNRYKFPADWLHLDNVEGEWSAMTELYMRKDALLQNEIPHLQERVMAEDQQIEKRIKEAVEQWLKQKPIEGTMRPRAALDQLSVFESKFGRLSEESTRVLQAKRALDMDVSVGDRVTPIVEEVSDLKSVWQSLSGPWDQLDTLGETPWTAVQPKKVRASLEALQAALKELPVMVRSYAAYEYLQSVIKGYLKSNFLLIDLRSHSMKDRHWDALSKKLRVQLNPSDMSLSTLWALDLHKNETAVKEIITISQGELALEEFIKQVREYWSEFKLELVVYQKKTSLIKGWDDLFSKVSEHVSSITSMKNSPYFKVFEEEAVAWEDKLNRIREIFDVWIEVQRRWVYLEGIFLGSAEIKHQLPLEFARFQSIDNEFVTLMKKVARAPLILEVIVIRDLLRSLERLGDLLGKIQKSLSEYLEQKRNSFPRFYFVGDEDLLEIIGNSKDPHSIQRHLSKMFAGINSITFSDEAASEVTAMVSSEGETVPFNKNVSIVEDPNVATWLSKVEAEMRSSLAVLTEKGITQLDKIVSAGKPVDLATFLPWVESMPAQLVILTLQILWTSRVEAALNKISDDPSGSMAPLEQVLQDTEGMLQMLAETVLKELTVIMRRKVEHTISELVHKRDATRSLIASKVSGPLDFSWLYYMRFYWVSTGAQPIEQRLRVKVANADFPYGFEYMGIADRLVQTPLTDRAYLTLTQALHSRMGGSPFGPAGTGKTETVKAMGLAMGKLVLVFNCDEAFDISAVGRILLGLVMTGAWGCMDEFNRLEERTLSAVSQQILVIQTGIRQRAADIELIGRTVKMNHEMGIFVTMNPGYAGRANLPDNLKQLFRSIAMSKPDSELIAQVMFFSQGFKTAERLSRKIVALFRLCGDQLSKQNHYDFGLRALKSVLLSSGHIKRESADAAAKSGLTLTEDEQRKAEELVLIKSFCGSVVPKLVGEDINLLYSLLSDVFPGAQRHLFENDVLRAHLETACAEYDVVPSELWMDKVMQLNQIINIHHGAMMVGPSGSGKTSAWRLLLDCLSRIDGVEGESFVIDPKAVSKEQLYGSLDPTTREWSDGVFTSILRKILDNVHGEKSKRYWIIFDGDVDPEWVENLNSVLDDNRLLTLPNGERLALPRSVRIMFEVQNLQYATQATVSRCGMVWFSDETVTVPMMTRRYLALLRHLPLEQIAEPAVAIFSKKGSWPPSGMQMEKSVQEHAAQVLAKHMEAGGVVERSLDYSKSQPHIMDFTVLRVVTALFSLINRSVAKIIEYNNSHPDFALPDDVASSYLEKSLVLSILWSFGGSTSLACREDFGKFLSGATTIQTPDHLIDYEVSLEDGNWSPWKKKVATIEIETSKVATSDVLISTVDTVRHEELLRGYLSERRPFILCGPPGSGKTMSLTAALRALPEVTLVPLNFSSGTMPDLILKSFDHYCEVRRTPEGLVLRPVQAGSWLVIFCDECNLPAADKYGTQKVVAFMRQLTEQGGFWRSSDLQWVTLERIQFIGACNPPTDAGRVPISHRYLRHAPLLFVDYPGRESLQQIYGTFSRALVRVHPEMRSYGEPLTNAMVEMYFRCSKRFTAEQQSHYIFSPRELSRWMRGLYEATKDKEGGLSPAEFVQFWGHEGLRLFQDRVVDAENRKWVDETVDEIAAQCFPSVPTASALTRPLLFSHWLKKEYSRVEREELRDFVKARLKVFSEEEFNVQLVVFNEVLDNILRIDRVLRQPLGHALLIGASGAGKTVLSRFVAWMNGLQVFQIKAHRGYQVSDFEDDLRKVMKRAGCKGEKICFIFDESNVLDAGFLELMNALLASGEVPGLFDGDEYGGLMAACKEAASRDGLMLDTEDELFKRFTQQVQRNLHVVFTMNPASADFQNRSTTSPALFNRCVINWVGDWSHEALHQVAYEFTSKLDMDDVIAQNVSAADARTSSEIFREAVVSSMVFVHESVHRLCEARSGRLGQHFYITPRHFLDFIQHFVKLFQQKRDEVQEQQLHLNQGLHKLRETEENVSELKAALALKEQDLASKNALANEKLQQMVHEQQEAERQREISIRLSKELEVKAVEMDKQKAIAQLDLDKATPMVEEAQLAVKDIKKNQLDELRTMANPPPAVKLALEAVCIMVYGLVKPTWDDIRKTIRKDDFIPGILAFDTEAFKKDSKKLKSLETYTKNPDFTFEVVNRGSKACGPLVKWCSAQCLYAEVLEKVDPLRLMVAELEASASKVEGEMKTLNAKIDQLQISIDRYKDEYAVLIAEVQNIKNEMKSVGDKVERSSALLASLSQERARWETQKEAFGDAMATMVGDVLLAAAFLAYSGMFEQESRRSLLISWMSRLDTVKVSFKNELSLPEYLSTGDDRLAWHANGLPEDDLCVENAIILSRFNRYPLVIDPSGQAISFMMKQNSQRKMVQTSFLDSGFMKQLESCMRFGTPLLVTDVEKVDPILNPVLNKEVHRAGGRVLIRLGENDIDLSPAFTLFLATRDSSYHFAPDLCSRVTMINFTITPSGLQSQCLTLLLKAERADVDQKRTDLLKLQGEYRVRLRHLESELLTSLSQSQGNILEDNTILATLERLKTESRDVEDKMSKTEEVMEEVQRVSSFYEPLAAACSRVFFVLEGLWSLHFLYRFSISFFFSVFESVLSSSNPSLAGVQGHNERLSILFRDLFLTTFKRSSRSLLNADRIVLALRLAQVRESCRDQELNPAHMDFLLKGGAALRDRDAAVGDAARSCKLSEAQESRLADVVKVSGFSTLAQHMIENSGMWVAWLDDAAPETSFPKGASPAIEAEGTAGALSRLVLLKALRPDRILAGSRDLVDSVFGVDFLAESEPNLRELVEKECGPRIPIVMVSLPGFDTSGRVDALAHDVKCNYRAFAMGSPEGYDQAEKAITSSAAKGGWVLLKNVHLAPAWLQKIEKRLHSIEAMPEFRLFMTMEINESVPASLLRTSQVVVYEPPLGTKASLQRSLVSMTPDRVNKAPAERPRLFLMLAWLHSVVQGRLEYAPLGWSKRYEFSEADQRSAMDAIDSWVDMAAQGRSNLPPDRIPWHALRTLLRVTCYGGRIDNDFDLRALSSFIDRFLSPEIYNSTHLLVEGRDGGDDGAINGPEGSSRQSMVEWVQGLPDKEVPRWLGLPDRSDILLRAENGRKTLAGLLQLQSGLDDDTPAASTNKTASAEEKPAWVKEVLQSVTDFLKLLPESLKILSAAKESSKDDEGPVSRFFKREVVSAASLLATVRTDLVDVQDALTGKKPGSNRTRSVTQSLVKGSIPTPWTKFYQVPPTTVVREWVQDLVQRLAQLEDLGAAEISGSGKGVRKVWLGGLIQVQGFFTATRQEMARAQSWPLELLTLRFTNSSSTPRAGSFTFVGAAVHASVWQADGLLPSPLGVSSLPEITLQWDREDAVGIVPNETDFVNLPIYANTDRREVIATVPLPLKGSTSAKMYERGAAITLWGRVE